MRHLAVTLTGSDNEYLKYPSEALLELFELGTNGTVIVGVFRMFVDGKQSGGPVLVRKPHFEYQPKGFWIPDNIAA